MTQPQTDYLSTAGPYNYEQPLPPVARTNAVTQVPPAKKITFYKSGDPQFGGVKMAINQRSFKSFNALMDDLSHRVPLPFGVRTITTPRGIHCISNLDQLEDGGCYLCSDKKYVTPINFGAPSRRAGPPRNSRPTSALRRAAQEAKREDYAATLTQQSPRIPKKITLVKNGDISTRRPIILNRRNARSFKTLLDEISEIMQFTVKKLYTVDGKRIDSMQALLHCPAVLVCVGREPFKPILTESSRKPSSEKLPGLASRSNSNNVGENSEMNFGLKAKKSVIHPRSSLSNRSTRFSLSSEKSFPNGLTTSPENGAASSNNCAHSKAGDLVHTLVNDDIEKKVHVNKDGSLSVEMKVRFRLLNDETLQWSTHIQKSSLLNQMPGEELGIGEDTGLDPTEKMNPEASSEADDSLYPCDADSYISKLDESEIEEPHRHNCGRQRKAYDIWKNPMHASQKEETGIRNTWYTHSSCSSTSSQRRIVRKKITSFTDSIRTSSSGEEYSEHIVRESSSYSETVKSRSGGRAAKKCCCQSDCTRPNTSQRCSPEEPEAAACLASSQNEDDEDAGEASMVMGEDGEGKGSRAGSGRSKASRCSIDSQTKVCEGSSTVARSLSSCSVKKIEDLEDAAGCVSTPNSICSKSSKCSTPRAKGDQEETSENEQVIPSFSSEHCPKKEATEDEAGKVEEDIDETNSISENMESKQSVKEEVSECERCSTGKSFHPQMCEGMRSDSDEVQICSVASSSSRISKKSKHSENHLEADSRVSSEESSTTTKKKKIKSSLHAEDLRSNSTASYCSRGSHELERTATEGHGSRDSNPHLSEVTPPSATNDESTSNISKHYSKSSRSSKKQSQPEATSSLHSSFSESNEKNRDGTAKISSQLPSSRTESMSESTCSKCGHVAIARNNNHQSVNSRISSHSSAKTKCTEAEKSEDACSQSSVAQSSKPRQKKTNSLQAEAENSSQASVSESASMYSLHCPVPPKGRPSNRKRRTVVLKKSSSSTSMCTELESTADKEHKEISDFSRLASSVSKSLEMDTANAEGNTSDTLKEETGSCQEKDRGGETEAAAGGGDEMIPSSLPNATPEEVVHEWLRNIPSETLLMKYEMDDDGEEGTDLSAEIPSDPNHQECLEGDKKKDDTEELEDTLATEAVEEEAEEQAEEVIEDHSEKASEVMSEKGEVGQAECGHSAVFTQNSPQRDLPRTIQTSVQIMKALLASKQEAKLDRSHSLPEMSPTMGRKLGNSAKILITCLTSLQLLDEELDPPDNSKPSSRSRYMELLNIFQTLWFGCASESSGPSTAHQGEEQEKVAPGIKAHPSKYGKFTATSSSGVDVGSGDGGSREGSVAGAQDRALSPEEIEEAEHTEEEAIEEQCEEIHSKSFLEEEETGGDEGEEEGPSRPPTACSKSERGEKAESSRAEEVAEAYDNQGSECEMGQEEEKENTREEAKKGNRSKGEDENGECAETDAEAHPTQEGLGEEPERGNSPNEEEADRATEQPRNGETESDPNASEANSERVKESNAEKQLVDEPPADEEPSNRVVHQATVTTSPPTQERSMEPDPVWVLKLLKKIEKEFMTHYVSAMNDFKLKWNLQNNEELDVMIAELKEEVSKRIQKSIEKELRKIQSRAGKRVPRPPNSELRRESTLQTGGRRRRLQSTHRTSLLSGSQSKQAETRNLSCDRDEKDFFFSTTIKDDVSDLLSDDEYCPCDACLRKKMSSKSTVNTVVVTSSAPVVKAFDLQKILQTKKDNGTEKREPDDMIEEIQDEKEVPIEPAEEEPEEHKENPATEPSEERNPGEINEDGTEVITDEVEAEGEEANNEERENETKTEGEEKAQEEEEEIKEDGAKEEVEEDKAEEEEQRGEEEDVKEKEEEEEEKEMNMDKQKGREDDVKEEDEQKEEEKEEEKEEGEDMKEEGEEKEEEEREEIREEEDVKQEEEIEEEEEEMKDDKEEENVEDKGEEEEGEVEEQKEEEDTKEEEEQKEGEEEMGEEEKEEVVMEDDQEERENMKDEERENREEEEMEEEEEKKQGEKMGKECEEKEEEEVEEEKGEGDMNEEEAEKEEKQEEEDEEKHVKEEVDEMQEEEVEEEEEKGEEEEEVEEPQDEKEEDVIEEDEEEEEAEVVMEEEEEMKEECKDDDEEMKDEKMEEEIDMKDEVEEKEKAEEEKVEENDVKEDEEKEEAEEEKEMDKEKEEAYMEAEEEPKLENETDGTVEEPKADEGDNQENASDCAENIADAETVQVSGEDGAQEDNDAEDETEATNRQETEEEASPETGCDACSETAEIEAASDDAGKEEEEAEGEESCEPLQNDEDEKTNQTEDEEIIEGLEPLRSASAFSYSSSIGNCSQQSQKGSEDGSDGADCIEEDNVNINNSVDEDALTDTKSKPAKMYPESVEEEEEEEEDCASSQESPMKGGEAKTTTNKKDGGQMSVKQGNSKEAIDPGDLDF